MVLYPICGNLGLQHSAVHTSQKCSVNYYWELCANLKTLQRDLKILQRIQNISSNARLYLIKASIYGLTLCLWHFDLIHIPSAWYIATSHWELNMLLNHFTALAKHIKAVWQLLPGRQIISTPLIPLLLTIIKSCAVINVPNKDTDFHKTSQEENTYIWYKKCTGEPSIFLCVFNLLEATPCIVLAFTCQPKALMTWVMEKSLPIASTATRRDFFQRKRKEISFGCFVVRRWFLTQRFLFVYFSLSCGLTAG